MSNKNRSQGPSSETIRKEAQAYREKWRIMEAREARLEQKRGLSQTKKQALLYRDLCQDQCLAIAFLSGKV